MFVIGSILKVLTVLVVSTLITLLINYIFVKDFRTLLMQTKRVISSPRKAKITQLKKILYNYFF